MAPLNGTWPSVEFSETDQEIRVTAEIPGLDENDVEVMNLDRVAFHLGIEIVRGATRVTLWGALAMGVTAAVGTMFGVSVG